MLFPSIYAKVFPYIHHMALAWVWGCQNPHKIMSFLNTMDPKLPLGHFGAPHTASLCYMGGVLLVLCPLTCHQGTMTHPLPHMHATHMVDLPWVRWYPRHGSSTTMVPNHCTVVVHDVHHHTTIISHQTCTFPNSLGNQRYG